MTSFIAWLWGKIKAGGRWLVTILVLAALIIVGIIIYNNNSDSNNEPSSGAVRPEVAQVFEPSIGTPLPPDTQVEPDQAVQTPADSQNSATEATPEATTTPPTTAAPTTGTVAGSATSTTYVAPKSGINLNAPITYNNSTYKFTATLPARSTVREEGSTISFFSANGNLLYSMSVVTNPESLDTIIEQLQNSDGVTAISKTTKFGYPAIQFTKNSTSGLVVLNNSTAYYLIGQKSYFEQFKI